MNPKCELASICPVYRLFSTLSSSPAGRHLLNAKKELLLAIKALLEKEVERIDQRQEKDVKAKKIKIK